MDNVTAESSNLTHTFVDTIGDTPITFFVIKMENCLFVWIGDKCVFENLAVAMNISSGTAPISTSIMGTFADDNSVSLATKLSKKTGKQVFASFNVSKSDDHLLLAVSKRLLEELTKHPENF